MPPVGFEPTIATGFLYPRNVKYRISKKYTLRNISGESMHIYLREISLNKNLLRVEGIHTTGHSVFSPNSIKNICKLKVYEVITYYE